jgi:hypothetical protein
VELSRQDGTVVTSTATCKGCNFTGLQAYFTIEEIISRGVPHFTATASGNDEVKYGQSPREVSLRLVKLPRWQRDRMVVHYYLSVSNRLFLLLFLESGNR